MKHLLAGKSPSASHATAAVIFALLAFFVFYPLIQLVLLSLGVPGPMDGGPVPIMQAFSSSLAVRAIWGTAWTTITTLVIAVPIAVFLAWMASCTNAPLARVVSALPMTSLAVSPLVVAIGWWVLLAPRVGLANVSLRQMFGIEGDTGPLNAFSLYTIIMVLVFYAVPYIYAPTYAALGKLDASLMEAAKVCGAGPFTATVQTLVPVLRPAIITGSLVASVMVASMLAIPLVLSSGTGLRLLSTQIYQSVIAEGQPAVGTSLAVVLVLASLAATYFYVISLRKIRFTTVSGKGVRPLVVQLGTFGRWLCTLLAALYLLASVVLPFSVIILLSLVPSWDGNIFLQRMNLDQYAKLISFPFALDGLRNSLLMSIVASISACCLGLLISYGSVRGGRTINKMNYWAGIVPLGVPSIVLGVGYLFASAFSAMSMYGTFAILILAYCVHVLPIAINASEAGLRQVAPELEEAARVCGDTQFGVIKNIVASIIRAPLLSGWAVTFIILFRDLSIAVMLYTPKTIPSSVAVLYMLDQGWVSGAAAYSIVVTLVCLLVIALVNGASRRVR